MISLQDRVNIVADAVKVKETREFTDVIRDARLPPVDWSRM